MSDRRIPALTFSVISLLAGGCGGEPSPTQRIDAVFYNGNIVTVDSAFSTAQAVAVRDGKIVAIGSDAEVRALAGRGTRSVDFQGKTVLPGFYDSHAHIGAGNLDPRVQDWEHITSTNELYDSLRSRASGLPRGEWILATLMNENMPQERLPNRWQVDSVAPDHPVFIQRGAHIWVTNSLALRLAGITRETREPQGGGIERTSAGEPMGWVREFAGARLVSPAIPPPPAPDDGRARSNMRDQLRQLLSYGITSVNIPGLRPGNEIRWLQDTYARWSEELPRATMQVRLWPGFDEWDDPREGIQATVKEIEGLAFHTGFGNDRLRIGAIKLSIDGGFSSAGFWTIPSYPGRPGYHGIIRIPESTLYPVAKRAHELGWQLGIHAIGDGGVQMTVNVLERILRESPRADHRHYIHHFSVKPPAATFEKMARLGILVSSQPNFTYSLGPYNASPGLTPERLATNNPQRSILSHGVRLAYGSDGMPLGPLVGIYAAVTRKGVDGKVYGPEEGLTLQEAIRAYTLGTAYLTFTEDNRGSLEVGKYADMIVLNQNILTVDPDWIKDLAVEQAIIGGEVVYRQPR